MTDSVDVQDSGVVLYGVHSITDCSGRICIIHRPTDGPHRDLPLHWRGDRGIFERICKHGVGHPDPDQYEYWLNTMTLANAETETVHGCDGCCVGWRSFKDILIDLIAP